MALDDVTLVENEQRAHEACSNAIGALLKSGKSPAVSPTEYGMALPDLHVLMLEVAKGAAPQATPRSPTL